MNRARILGTGFAVPKKLLTNPDLEKLVETSDQWITERTGIKERHIMAEGEKFSDLCTKAAEIALKRAHVKPEELDMILLGTISGDMPFPATSCLVQKNLGATRAAASSTWARPRACEAASGATGRRNRRPTSTASRASSTRSSTSSTR